MSDNAMDADAGDEYRHGYSRLPGEVTKRNRLRGQAAQRREHPEIKSLCRRGSWSKKRRRRLYERLFVGRRELHRPFPCIDRPTRYYNRRTFFRTSSVTCRACRIAKASEPAQA